MNSAKPTDELKFSCPRCGQHLACEAGCAGTVIRCPACALDFAAPSLAPTAQPPAQPYQTPTLPGACACPNCGSALPADAVLCVQCGYKFARGKGISTYVSARPGAFAPLLRRLLWVTAAAIVLIGAFVLWSSSKLPAPPPPSPSVLRARGPGTVKEWVDGEGKTHQYVLKAGDKEDPYEPFYDFVVGNPELTSPALFNFRYLRAIRTSQRIAFFEYSPSGELTDELGRHVAGRTRHFDTKSLSAVADWLELYVAEMQRRYHYFTPGEWAYLRVPFDEAIPIARGKGVGASMSETARRRAVVAWLEQEPKRVKLWTQAYLARWEARNGPLPKTPGAAPK